MCGHSGPVYGIHFSHDKTFLASASEDGTSKDRNIILWFIEHSLLIVLLIPRWHFSFFYIPKILWQDQKICPGINKLKIVQHIDSKYPVVSLPVFHKIYIFLWWLFQFVYGVCTLSPIWLFTRVICTLCGMFNFRKSFKFFSILYIVYWF